MSIIFNPKRDQRIIRFVDIGSTDIVDISACWFLTPKWAISGLDLFVGKISHSLQNDGVKVKIEYKKANLRPQTAF